MPASCWSLRNLRRWRCWDLPCSPWRRENADVAIGVEALSSATIAVPQLTTVQAAAADYISRRGIRAFMNEDYNLTGTRVRALVTEENADLALAFGLPITPDT